MVGIIIPDCGGGWVEDSGGGNGGELPTVVLQHLREFGKKGVVISSLIAWMETQVDQECDVWRPLAERNWIESEVSQAKEALKAACGPILDNLVPDFSTKRKKKEKEIEDIRKAIVALQNNNSMPLVLASSGMMGRCPPSWGQPSAATSQDIMGKIHMLEKVMTDHMECQRKQMDQLGLEISSIKNNGARPKNLSLVPTGVLDDVETPNSKKRRLGDCLHRPYSNSYSKH